jgi:hypothetical protein
MSEDTDFTGQSTGQAVAGADEPLGTNALVSGPDRGTETASETSSAVATLKDQAVELKDQAVDKGQKVLAQTMAQTKASAGQAIERAKDQVKSQIASRKDQAADSLSGAVRALEATGQQLRGESQVLAADYADSLTGQVRRASDYLSGRSVDDIARDVEDFARKNPSLFIGGAFVLGIALARFLRSSEMSAPLAAFATGRNALVPVTPPALPNGPQEAFDAFGGRPLTAHNYVPGIGVTSSRDGA